METEIEIIEPKKINWKKSAFFVFILLLGLSIIFFGARAYTFTKQIIVAKSSNASPYLSGGIDSLSGIDAEKLASGDRRINILLLGIGGENHPGGTLTDTILVVSIDPKNKEVAMLSVPRDLFVKVPGYGYQKINSVYALGQSNYDDDYKKYELVKNTISDVLGVPIHYFGLVNFDGFKKVIDIIGGVDVYVEKDLYDPYFPDKYVTGYDELFVEKGMNHFDGEEALKYARSRETTSDFDRSRRQQQILMAVKDKTMSKENMMSVKKVSQIMSILQDNLKTDLQLSEIEELMKFAKDVDKEKIYSKVLSDSEDVIYSDNVDGMYVLRPRDSTLEELHTFVKQYFKDPFMVSEQSKITITDGAGSSYIVQKVANTLKGFGYDVSENNGLDTEKKYEKTFIYDYTNGKKKFTLEFLKEYFSNATVIKLNEKDKGTDFEIVLGKDQLSQ